MRQNALQGFPTPWVGIAWIQHLCSAFQTIGRRGKRIRRTDIQTERSHWKLFRFSSSSFLRKSICTCTGFWDWTFLFGWLVALELFWRLTPVCTELEFWNVGWVYAAGDKQVGLLVCHSLIYLQGELTKSQLNWLKNGWDYLHWQTKLGLEAPET